MRAHTTTVTFGELRLPERLQFQRRPCPIGVTAAALRLLRGCGEVACGAVLIELVSAEDGEVLGEGAKGRAPGERERARGELFGEMLLGLLEVLLLSTAMAGLRSMAAVAVSVTAAACMVASLVSAV